MKNKIVPLVILLTFVFFSASSQSNTLGDTLMSFNAGVLTPTPDRNLYGVEFVDGYFWVTGADPDDLYQHKLYKFSADGETLVDFFEYGLEFAGWSDLAYDGQFLYVADIDTIRQIDMQTGQKTGVKIPGPEYYLRGLAYDAVNDLFWVSGESNVIYNIDRQGNIIDYVPFYADLPATGLAWDTWTQGGPYLWVWSMKYTPSDVRPQAFQVNPATGTYTGVEFEGEIMNPQAPYAADYSLGMCISDQLVTGKTALITMHGSSFQQYNDQLDWVVAYDMDPDGLGLPGPQISVFPESIQNDLLPGDSLEVPVSVGNLSPEYELNWRAGLEYPGSIDTTGLLGDTLLTFDATAITSDENTRLRSVAYAGDHIYVCSGIDFNDQFKVYKMAKDGSSVVSTITLYSAFSGWTAMTSDERYLYGAEQYHIAKYDTETGAIVDNYLKTGFSPTSMAYDPQMELFYLGNSIGAIRVIDKQGEEVNFFITPFQIEGLSWDKWSPGGPYLWAYYHEEETGDMKAIQLNPNTGGPVGATFSGISLGSVPDFVDTPEDIHVTPNWQENKLVMISLQETNTQSGSDNDKIAVYDLATIPAPGWIELMHPSFGNTGSLSEDTLWVKLKAIMEDTLVVAQVVLKSNDVLVPNKVIPVNFRMLPDVFTGFRNNLSGNDERLKISRLWPNPANDNVWLELNALYEGEATIQVFDYYGREVSNKVNLRYLAGEKTTRLNVSGLPPGNYLIRLSNDSDIIFRKLIKI